MELGVGVSSKMGEVQGGEGGWGRWLQGRKYVCVERGGGFHGEYRQATGTHRRVYGELWLVQPQLKILVVCFCYEGLMQPKEELNEPRIETVMQWAFLVTVNVLLEVRKGLEGAKGRREGGCSRVLQ